MTDSPRTVLIMDTTLRDGEQTHGVSFSADEKANIAKAQMIYGVLDSSGFYASPVAPGDRSRMNAFGLLMGLMATDKLGDFTAAAERPVDPSQLQMVAEIKKQMRDQAVAEAKQSAKPAPKAPGSPAPDAEV